MQTEQSLPTAEQAAIAKLCSQELAGIVETKGETQSISITSKSGETHNVEMPINALRLMIDVLTQLGEGNMVKLMPIHAELTTQEGADLLNVSRPTFVKLLDDGDIDFHRVGNRRKVKFNDLKNYQDSLKENRLQALDALSGLDQSLGLGY